MLVLIYNFYCKHCDAFAIIHKKKEKKKENSYLMKPDNQT